MRKGILCSLPVASALFLSASFPPWDLGILAWFGLSPLLYGLRQRGTLGAAVLGSLFGCLFCTGAFFWVNSVPGVNLANFLFMLTVFGLLLRPLRVRLPTGEHEARPWTIIAAPALWVAPGVPAIEPRLSRVALEPSRPLPVPLPAAHPDSRHHGGVRRLLPHRHGERVS